MLTLEEVKLHCRVDHDDEDAAIDAMRLAAEAAVTDYLGSVPSPAPEPVRAAALLLAADLYAHREAQTERPLTANPMFERLLHPYRQVLV